MADEQNPPQPPNQIQESEQPKEATLPPAQAILQSEPTEVKPKKEWNWTAISATVSAMATVVIAVLTASYVDATKGMLTQMSRQTSQTDSTLDLLQQQISEMRRSNNFYDQQLGESRFGNRLTGTNVDLQREYYRKTTRPFVYVSRVEFLYKENKDSFLVAYYIKNVGNLPARDLIMSLHISIEKDMWFFDGKRFRNEPVISPLYPQQEMPATATRFGYLKVNELKGRYLHFIVSYKDMGGLPYYYHGLVYIDDVVTARMLNIWSDFN